LGLGVGLFLRHRSARDDAGAGGSAATAHQRGSGADHGAFDRTSRIPEWATQSGAPSRRIAGRVVFDGKPIGGAKVTLGFEALGEAGPVRTTSNDVSVMGILQRVAETRSTPDGSFDFGVQPAMVFTVSASADNYSSGAVVVDNANPRSTPDHLIVSLGACGIRL